MLGRLVDRMREGVLVIHCGVKGRVNILDDGNGSYVD